MSIQDPSDDETVVRIGTDPSSFEIVVLGSGGGPLETDLSCYLLKPFGASWEDGCISLEAGSGIGSLAQLLQTDPSLFPASLFAEPAPGTPVEEVALARAAKVFTFVRSFLVTHAHLDHVSSLILGTGGLPPPTSSNAGVESWSSVREVYGSLETLLNLETVFGEKVWPDIAGFPQKEEDNSGKVLRFVEFPATPSTTPSTSRPPTPPSSTPVRTSSRRAAVTSTSALPSPPLPSQQAYTQIPSAPSSSSLSVLALPISHGSCSDLDHRRPSAPKAYALRPRSNGKTTTTNGASSSSAMQGVESSQREDKMKSYETSAFFIKSESAAGGPREFCFFGDVEPDSISLTPRNRRVWSEVATRFAAGVLNTVFIECSYLSSRPDALLYGHLSPPHILDELATLVSLLPSGHPPSLDGLTICVIHCKENFGGIGPSVRARIVEELRVGARERAGGLEGARWIGVRRGMRLLF